MSVDIKWKKYLSYKSASDCTECIYLFVSKGQPNYIGVCVKSVFGGSKREVGGETKCPRYGASYGHIIEGFLGQGGELYIGKCKSLSPGQLKGAEASLIGVKRPTFNRDTPKPAYSLTHSGDVPGYLVDR